MRHIIDLNVTKSINKNKLIAKTEWGDVPSQLTIYFVAAVFVLIEINIIPAVDYSVISNRVFVVVPLVLMSGASFFIAYRKATEKHLLRISTSFDAGKNKAILSKYICSKGYKTCAFRKDCLIFKKTSIGEFIDYRTKTAVFIIRDHLVLFTILEENSRLNWPTFFSHLTIKRELEEILGKPDND